LKKEERNVLIDTSAWVDFFRGTSGAADQVARLIEKGQASICGVISYELVQGAKSEDEAVRLTGVLSALHYVEMTPELWVMAGNISAGLRRKGIILPVSDLLIGAIALGNGLDVLTVDDHFASIPGLKQYHHE
jgi:predicted nucleic acid-binding protein